MGEVKIWVLGQNIYEYHWHQVYTMQKCMVVCMMEGQTAENRVYESTYIAPRAPLEKPVHQPRQRGIRRIRRQHPSQKTTNQTEKHDQPDSPKNAQPRPIIKRKTDSLGKFLRVKSSPFFPVEIPATLHTQPQP